jgi:hypothetical protein
MTDMARKRWKSVGRQESGTFLRVPTDVLLSKTFRSLSTKAKALILDIGTQYNGHNNGHLSPSWALMREQGWVSKQTLQAALEELIEKGLLEQTRQGGRHRCSLHGFTWMPIDKGPAGASLDVPPTKVASGLWRRRSEEIAEKIASASPTIGARIPDHRVNDG